MAFTLSQKVLFKHCDPAGIVFYPRYFEMMNDCVEAFFTEIGWPFETLHETGSVPTAQIETRFAAPSRHGDHLTLTMWILSVGRTSASYLMHATCEGEIRFETRATLVFVGEDGGATPWPPEIKSKLQEMMERET
jgi:4-hydroxybenzoyl-CoA thioesterase